MREIFEQYAKQGAMTKEELAAVLKLKPSNISDMARAGKIPRIQGLRLLRFDPMAVHAALFPEPKAASRSLTIERHKTFARKTNGGYAKCL